LIAFLRDKQMLIILDSCEHVVEAAAALAEQVFKGVPGTHILATSREPLRAEGEWVQRVPPLSVPPASARVKAEDALVFPAVQLFVERATASLDTLELKNTEAPVVADICRRLDGIPLAIELAAGQVDVVGVMGLAALLDDRFRLLMKGRRTALPRHQTLSATLDWSHELLPEPERVILRRLAVFTASFSFEAVRAVAAGGEITLNSIDDFANLVAKSLVMADVAGPTVLYRLPETTRNYALEKLAASGELQQVARRHAEYSRDMAIRTSFEADNRPASEWLGTYSRQIDDIRAALDWAFSSNGDAAIGVALMAASVPLWTYLSLMEECRRRVEQALASLATAEHRNSRHEMQLHAALGAALLYTKRTTPETRLAFAQALEIAERLDDIDYRTMRFPSTTLLHFATPLLRERARSRCSSAISRPRSATSRYCSNIRSGLVSPSGKPMHAASRVFCSFDMGTSLGDWTFFVMRSTDSLPLHGTRATTPSSGSWRGRLASLATSRVVWRRSIARSIGQRTPEAGGTSPSSCASKVNLFC
jgi:predicted ATPase